MNNVIPIRPSLAAQLRASIDLAPIAKARGVSIREVMRQREERRNAKLSAVDLARARNEMDCCATCGEPLDARSFMAWCPVEMIVSHAGCA
jgi:hypothetical protein